MICLYCGCRIEKTDSYCSHCGAPPWTDFNLLPAISFSKKGYVNIRSGPGIENKILGCVEVGTTVNVLNKINEWIEIKKGEWVNSMFVEIKENNYEKI